MGGSKALREDNQEIARGYQEDTRKIAEEWQKEIEKSSIGECKANKRSSPDKDKCEAVIFEQTASQINR